MGAFHQNEAMCMFSWVGGKDGRVCLKTNDALLSHLRFKFSIADKAASYMRRTYGNMYPTRKYAITPTGRFRYGLLKDIVTEIKQVVKNPIISVDDLFKKNYPKKMHDALEIGAPNLKLTPRDYQMDGITTALTQGCGILLYPTGSGKTLIMAGIIRNILDSSVNSSVMVVTLTHLVEQTAESFVSYGFDRKDISLWTGNHEFVPARIVICGPQILNSAMRNKEKYSEPIDFMGKVESFIVDEVHQCKAANSISDFEKYVNTKHRFGFTGTLPENKLDEWAVIGMFGPVVKTIERSQLVDNGSITDVVVAEIKMKYQKYPDYYRGNGMQSGISNFRNEQDFLYENPFRNKTIAKFAVKTQKNCLILVDRIEHGMELERIAKEMTESVGTNKKVFFIQGSVEGEVREEIKKKMESGDDVVCIAISSIFSTGINISNLHYIIFGNCCKAKVSIIQSIGRGVRTHDGKRYVTVFDIHDDLRYGNKLFKERMKLYADQGFKTVKREVVEPPEE